MTPLNERQIIFGRLRGLWFQFLPTFAVWLAIVLYLYGWQREWEPADLVRFGVAYAVVPVIGLYFSLRTRFVLLAWFATLAVCFALPQILWWLCRSMLLLLTVPDWDASWRALTEVSMLTSLAQLALAGGCFAHLHAILVRRIFAMR